MSSPVLAEGENDSPKGRREPQIFDFEISEPEERLKDKV